MKNFRAAVVISELIAKAELAGGIFLTLVFGFWLILFLIIGKYTIPIIVFSVLIVLSIGLILLSRRRKKQLKTFREYVARLSHDSTGSITALAKGVNRPREAVAANLQKFIDKKYFVNAYLDRQEGRIVFPPREAGEETVYKTVTCKSCGGTNQVSEGKTGECEYCGSYL